MTTIATLRKSTLLSRAALIALTVGAAGSALAAEEEQPSETIIVTGTKFNTDAAPAKASLDTTEPQTIINRSYIENFTPPTSDYVTILAIVPGMTGGDPNGPGLSDGGAKNTLRGMGDGNFVMQYDGVPFGDTNGPTHHNISYFPASTIGSAVVDRGPGNAGNLGAATYGGTVKLFSQTLSDDPHAMGSATYGSFNTKLAVANLQTGKLDWLGDTKIMLNLQSLGSDGALSLQDVREKNFLFKSETPIGPNWKLTMFADYSYLKEHLDDNNGLTPAQVVAFGKDFALQNSDPSQPTFQSYNWTNKATDMDYIRLNGEITPTTRLDTTAYTYSYWNHTFSPNAQTQECPTATSFCAASALSNDDTVGKNKWFYITPGTGLISKNAVPSTDLLAYDKVNSYRVFGGIIRASQDYDFGWVSGEVRTGVWLEEQTTHRYKYMFDMTSCASKDVDPWNVGLSQAALMCGVGPAASGSNTSLPGGIPVGAKYAPNGALGYAKDDEYSGWEQYQPFLEVDIKPTEALTITPGVKYVHFNHNVNAQVAQGSLCGVSVACAGFNALGQSFTQSFVTTDTLPFLTVNYKIQPNWSVYGEFAKGIYVPDVSAFENSSPVRSGSFPNPETTTNYQLGTVFYADNFTFDADIYLISIANNFITATDNQGDTFYVNDGKALYKGIEGEGTYAFSKVGDIDLSGFSVFANGALMDSKQTGGGAIAGNNPELYAGKWEPNAPRWTFAGGLLFKRDDWKFAIIDKVVGAQYSDAPNDGPSRLPSYNNLNLTAGYAFGFAEASISIDNLLNSRSIINISAGDAKDVNGSKTVAAFGPTSVSQYFYQAPRSVMGTLKVKF